MNGAGNDFIIINNIDENIPLNRLSDLARTLCHRRFSIGADGFMAVERAEGTGDFRMLFLNSDGSMGEMCGNGARCICRYGFETGLSGETQKVETTAGLVTGRRVSKREYRIRLNDPAVMRLDEKVSAGGAAYVCSYVELGDPGIPHCVIQWKGLREYPKEKLYAAAKALRSYGGYPKGANVNFYDVEEDGKIFERTFERGVEDFTYACGTGTGATAAVLTLKGIVSGKDVAVCMVGGQLVIDVAAEGGQVRDIFLTGPTNVVAKGEVTDEDFIL